MEINFHIIELINNQQLPFESIYSLEFIELEILKTYIKTILVHSFIGSFNFLVRVFSFFVKKSNKYF